MCNLGLSDFLSNKIQKNTLKSHGHLGDWISNTREKAHFFLTLVISFLLTANFIRYSILLQNLWSTEKIAEIKFQNLS